MMAGDGKRSERMSKAVAAVVAGACDDDNEGWQEVVDAPGYTAKQMREYAAQQVAAERERWRDAVMMELDSNGQAHAIVADATRA